MTRDDASQSHSPAQPPRSPSSVPTSSKKRTRSPSPEKPSKKPTSSSQMVAPPSDAAAAGTASSNGSPAAAASSVQPIPPKPPIDRKRPGRGVRIPESQVRRHQNAPPRRSPPPARPPRERSTEARPDIGRQRSASPPRQRKRPGAGARISNEQRDALQSRVAERERARDREQQERIARARAAENVDAVAQHYNAVPQRGREWRSTESTIRNLRSYNNWVKSTLVQKFAPEEGGKASQPLKVLDVGCGKGGDLQKWANAPQPVELYVGIDPAEVSIQQAKGRYAEMQRRQRRGAAPLFQGEFFVRDGFGEWLGDIPLIRNVGIDEDAAMSRWSQGGFDVVSMMFCMHYAYQSEDKARGMLRNVAGALKKGGRFIGVIPNSDIIRERLVDFYAREPSTVEQQNAGGSNGFATKSDASAGDSHPNGHPEGLQGSSDAGDAASEAPATTAPATASTNPASNAPNGSASTEGSGAASTAGSSPPEWGNSLYRVRFPLNAPRDGKFRPPFGWKYSYFLEEAVEEVPEYVVPWEAFRAHAEDFNLELQYRRSFLEVWAEERDDAALGPLSVRMKVTDRVGGELRLTADEREAVSFYHAFCFYKV